jgi:hypothetical protein
MFRTTTMAALALALLSSAAMAQSGPNGRAEGPPTQMSGNNNSYDDRDSNDDRDDGPPPASASQQQTAGNAQAAQDQRSRDMFCRRDAAARTGYVTPGEAAHDSKTSAQVGGTLGGAALGAAIGSASHSAGVGALIGAGAGLIAGTAIGSDNAHHAAADVEHAYSDAYYACMDEADDRGPPDQYAAYGPPPGYGPPPPAYYAPYPYYYPPYYGPSVSLGFGFGGHRGWHGGHGFHHR